ncbi:N-acetylmuramoyl-L-alanine amidase [Corynebacterium sp. P5875]|uniref:N-acetylmuramoyl-L-alanine amidase n=1 Tax=Corynebacterium antarcticum TaxID=2800405 RepID=A0A9Q4GMA5_9CORY|nr:N-acetylmuramoyl-L-alanine amidase [Corynebacterium antarcticum]MCX7538718.1 N-acetylmuramoyl-L-alanine amidase [Corynebacterium antarcticum]
MKQRRRITTQSRRPALAVILSAALIASAVVGVGDRSILRTNTVGTEPVTAAVSTASFATGRNVVVPDAAIISQGGETTGSRVVKEFTRDEEFSMFALTWHGEKDIAAFFRAKRADGSWSPWYDAEPAGDIQDPTGPNGTELIYVEPTHTIQVSTGNIAIAASPTGADPVAEETTDGPAASPSGQPATFDGVPEIDGTPVSETGHATNVGEIAPVAEVIDPDAIEAVFIDGRASEGTPVDLVNAEEDARGMPKVISRKGWGADESKRCGDVTIDDQVSALTIHHTAGSNDYTPSQAAGIVRGIYQYHAQNLGWCDIGYQSLVDKYGRIYEGRYGGMNRAVQGAHAGGFNENTWAISMIGDYSTVTPSPETLASVGELAGWRAKVAGFDPLGSDTHYSEGTSYTKYPYGQAVTLPNIFAHRDVGNTSCPGDAGYAQMGTIRGLADAKYKALLRGEDTTGGTTTTERTTTEPAPTEAAPTTTTAPPEKTTTTTATTTRPTPTGDQDADQDAAEPGPAATLPGSSGSRLNSILGVAGSLLSVVIAFLTSRDGVPQSISQIGQTPIIAGLKLSDVPALVDKAVSSGGDPKVKDALNRATTVAGPVLGSPRGGTQIATPVGERNSRIEVTPFDGGLVVSSPETGTHAIWGAIGDAWAAQGFDAGPLGMPVNEEYRDGDLIRTDFQGGWITFDPATGDVQIHES